MIPKLSFFSVITAYLLKEMCGHKATGAMRFVIWLVTCSTWKFRYKHVYYAAVVSMVFLTYVPFSFRCLPGLADDRHGT